MWLRTTLGVGLSVVVLIACGGDGGSPSQTQQAPSTASNATEPPVETPAGEQPASEPPKEEETGPKQTSVVTASPSCAPVGSRVVLKLGMTFDHRSVDCYDVDAVQVVFAPEKHAKVTVMGPMSDGFCAIDVEVPKGAESGPIRVDVGSDTFRTDATFPVPCP
jgi:hypothetical protein